jgi:hypothetical protein
VIAVQMPAFLEVGTALSDIEEFGARLTTKLKHLMSTQVQLEEILANASDPKSVLEEREAYVRLLKCQCFRF